MITSSRHRHWAGDVDISDIDMAGLPAASMIRSAKLATVEAVEADKLGVLPATDRDAVRAAIKSRLHVMLRKKKPKATPTGSSVAKSSP
jgi:mRNA interferase MazF